MKALLHGQLTEVAEPIAGAGETIVEVRAAGVNRADLLQIAGKYPPPPGATHVLGLEAAGVDLQTGKRVCVLLAGGGMAERVAVDKRLLMPIADSLSYEQAAALPEAFLTAYANIFVSGRLQKGEWVLIHAVTSGVGTAAAQMANLHGAFSLGTGRNAEKLSRVAADVVVDVTTQDFVARAKEVTAGQGVNVVLDVLGTLDDNLRALAVGGRVVVIALMQASSSTLDLRALMARRLTIVGSTLRGRSIEEKAGLVAAFNRDWLHRVTPIVDSVFPFVRASDAFARMQANANVGKIVLSWA